MREFHSLRQFREIPAHGRLHIFHALRRLEVLRERTRFHCIRSIRKIAALAAARVHGSHGTDAQVFPIDQRVTAGLGSGIRRDRAVQLAADGLTAQLYHLVERIGRSQILVIGIKGGGIGRNQVIDLTAHSGIKCIKAAARHVFFCNFLQVSCILRMILLVIQQGIKKLRTGEGIFNGTVDHAGSIAAASHTAKGEIIVPGQQVQLSIGFIEIIIMRHVAG